MAVENEVVEEDEVVQEEKAEGKVEDKAECEVEEEEVVEEDGAEYKGEDVVVEDEVVPHKVDQETILLTIIINIIKNLLKP